MGARIPTMARGEHRETPARRNAALKVAGLPPVAQGPFSDEDVVEELRADARRLGRSPTRDEWRERTPGAPGDGAVVSHFGSWNAALRAAGLKPTHDRRRWTREQVLTALRADAERQGRTPTSKQWERRPATRPGYNAVRKHFGSWNAAIEAAGLVPEDPKWTRDTVLHALRELERELGRQPTSGDLPLRQMVIKRTLGSWAAACDELGWKTRTRRSSEPAGGERSVSDQELLDVLGAAFAELGTISRARYDAISSGHGWPSARVIGRRFGSWNAAVRAAGLTPNTVEHWTREMILDALRTLERELGRQPTYDDLRHPPSGYPGGHIVSRRLGSWAAACDELGWTPPRQLRRDHELLDALRSAAAQSGGRFIASSDYETISCAHGWPASQTIIKRFGSWQAALRAAQLDETKWTREATLDALRKLERELGREPTYEEVRRPPNGYPSAHIIRTHFGTWAAARGQLGWTQRKRRT